MSTTPDLRYKILSAASSGGALTTRNEVSKSIQDGKFYACVQSAVLANNAFISFAISVGDEPAAIISAAIVAQAQSVTMNIYEGAVSPVGTASKCLNLNRLYPTPDPSKNVTVLNATGYGNKGTQLVTWKIVGQRGNAATDFTTGNIDGPLVLKPNTIYIFESQNTSGEAGRDFQLSLRYIDR